MSSTYDQTTALNDASPGGSRTPTGSSSSSRKGKERVVNDLEVDEVNVGGEVALGSGDATKGLREFVRRTTMGEEIRGSVKLGESSKEMVQLEPAPGRFSFDNKAFGSESNRARSGVHTKTVLRPDKRWQTRLPLVRFLLFDSY